MPFDDLLARGFYGGWGGAGAGLFEEEAGDVRLAVFAAIVAAATASSRVAASRAAAGSVALHCARVYAQGGDCTAVQGREDLVMALQKR